MKQVIRWGLKEIIVDEVADPLPSKNHVQIRSSYSLISSGTKTVDIHRDKLVKEVADNSSHLQKFRNITKKTNPFGMINMKAGLQLLAVEYVEVFSADVGD